MAKFDRRPRTFRFDHDEQIPMRDGTVLRADVQRPDGDGPVPVLLVRTPYGEPFMRQVPVTPLLEAGIAVVVQQCRGTGTSDGDFVPFAHEADDAADTVAWCAAQPWCDGRVGMLGASYSGMAQFAAAAAGAPALRALVPVVTPADYHWGLAYRQGAVQLGQVHNWFVLKSWQQLARAADAGEDVRAEAARLRTALSASGATRAGLPLRQLPMAEELRPAWQDWLDHEQRDAYWTELGYAGRREGIRLPALHIGGWFDIFLDGTLDNFTTMAAAADTEQHLIVGPWSHTDRSGALGELSFGRAASDVATGLERTQIDFLVRHLLDRPETTAGPAVTLFVMGDNVWRHEDEWPLARTAWTPWYLHPTGDLSPVPPVAGAAPSGFAHDPADPVPTVGGATLMTGGSDGGTGYLPGPRDQRLLDHRSDILRFTGAPLTEDVEVTGPVRVVLHAATSAADTDFTARLVDVWPDGRAMGVTDGIVRARFREGPEAAVDSRPGRPYRYVIDLMPTSQVFKAGHRIRLDVASSNFPCYDVNPGNGAPAGTATAADFVVAEQTVFHDASRPSHVILPVIPRHPEGEAT